MNIISLPILLIVSSLSDMSSGCLQRNPLCTCLSTTIQELPTTLQLVRNLWVRYSTLNSDMQGGCSTSFKQPFLVSSFNFQDDVHCLLERLTLFILNWHLWDMYADSHVRSIGDEIFRLVSTWLRSDENVGRCSMLNRNAENTEEVIGWQHLHPDIKHSSWRCMNCGIGLDPFTNIWL